MKKLLLIAVVALATAVLFAPAARAQSASFTYSPIPASLQPGSTFTININVVFTSGGSINNLAGFSGWLWQASPAGPYPFTLVAADLSGSAFNGNAPVPQVLDPIMRPPGGGSQSGFGGTAATPYASGTYRFGTFTFSIAGNAQPGLYTIGSTTSNIPNVGGRFSVITDSDGDLLQIADSRFTVNVVPEPGTWALLCIGAVLTGAAGVRRRLGQR
jgi:hypothetical protein